MPVQHQTWSTGTFEAAQRVETYSFLADALHLTLVDVFQEQRNKFEMMKCSDIYKIRDEVRELRFSPSHLDSVYC